MSPYLTLAVSEVLRHVPGAVGERFETRGLWARRKVRARSSADDFAAELARLGPDSLCLDLGANVGVVTEQLAAVAGHVHAFEPDPWAFAQLSARVGGRANVTLHNKAIGPADGALTLYRDPHFADDPAIASQGTTAHSSLLWQPGDPGSFEVEMVDIRRFIRGCGRTVDLIKMDIEGAEVAVLEALLDAPELDQVGIMFVETHECQIRELRARTRALRARIGAYRRPRFYLDWH